ncbi:MAG: pirin family protein [Leptospirales bacterium]|nr:pirin family protein [Leptospirales bacterium]
MSWTEPNDPECKTQEALELVIEAKERKITDHFSVRRLIPIAKKRSIGPFIFFDHMGPVDLLPENDSDVLPHPHIGLATVTYLFEGEIFHRDRIGSAIPIRPGDINWMTAGRGIVHSERTTPEESGKRRRLHGLQLWVALPAEQEETDPAFEHQDAAALPATEIGGVKLRILAGSAYGQKSPVRILSPLFYVDAHLPANTELEITEEYAERSAYIVSGSVSYNGVIYKPGTMLVFQPAAKSRIKATEETRVMLLGGPPLDGPRHMYWNFVSTSRDRIEKAKRDWAERRFPAIPDDDIEFVPLPA